MFWKKKVISEKLNKRKLSPYETMEGFWSGRYKCNRCGGKKKDVKYTSGYGLNMEGVSASPVCDLCWEEMSAEGRLQWILLLMAEWARDYKEKPITYDPPHFQARYRDWPLKLEQSRRVLFEPPVYGDPQFSFNYRAYKDCYLYSDKHELFPIPPINLAICTICRAWFTLEGKRVNPWEEIDIPEGQQFMGRLVEYKFQLELSGPHYCPLCIKEKDKRVELYIEKQGGLRCPECGAAITIRGNSIFSVRKEKGE